MVTSGSVWMIFFFSRCNSLKRERELISIIMFEITEGKITECWLINEKGFFFFLNFGCEEGKITRSQLVLNSNSLFYRLVVFFVSRYLTRNISLRDKGNFNNFWKHAWY